MMQVSFDPFFKFFNATWYGGMSLMNNKDFNTALDAFELKVVPSSLSCHAKKPPFSFPFSRQVSPTRERRGDDTPVATDDDSGPKPAVPKLNLGGITAVGADGIAPEREKALLQMFRKLDLDRSGVLTKSELMTMSQARRFLGLNGEGNFPAQEGDDEENERLLSKMDTNRDGVVDEEEFMEYFGNHWFGGMNAMSDQEFQAAQDMFMQIGAEAAIMHAEELVGGSSSREGSSRVSTPRVTTESSTDQLKAAFEAFDPHDKGYITPEEIFTLCQVRRRLSGKTEWTRENNDRLVGRMDLRGTGRINSRDFVTFFNELLPQEEAKFARDVSQFFSAAHEASTRQKTPSQPVKSSTQQARQQRENQASSSRASSRVSTPRGAERGSLSFRQVPDTDRSSKGVTPAERRRNVALRGVFDLLDAERRGALDNKGDPQRD